MNKPIVTAIIYDKRGKILSIGKNSYVKTHPLQAKIATQVGEPHKIYLHAEIHAITRLSYTDKPHKIEVYRFNKKAQPAIAKPCRVCQEALRMVGIKEIVHT